MPKYALCLALLVPAVLATDDDPEPKAKAVQPREIVVAGIPTGQGRVESPTSIPSEKHLAGIVADKGVRAAILKQVDFKKERLLLFRWRGSPGDRLTPQRGRAGEAVFVYAESVTDDCVLHVQLFAVPAKAKVKVKLTVAQ
jgi:hypothetical protein